MQKKLLSIFFLLLVGTLKVTYGASIDDAVRSIRDRFKGSPMSMSKEVEGAPDVTEKPENPESRNVLSIIEKELKAETEAIMKGFNEISARLDHDFKFSGEEEMKNLEDLLKRHSSELRKRFNEMSENMRKGIHEMFTRGDHSDHLDHSDEMSSSDEHSLLAYLRNLG